ncbi:MAG: hypothetical protein RR311_00220 [Comamonas sp.]
MPVPKFARYGWPAQQLKGWIAPDLLWLDDFFLTQRIADVRAELLQSIVDRHYKLLAGSSGCAAIARDNHSLPALYCL